MRPNERVAMTRIGEVLDHAVRYLQHVNEIIHSQLESAPTERVRMLLGAFELEQRALTGAIERYQEDAEERVLGRFVNFSVELPAAIAGPDSNDSTLAVTEWLVGVNTHLHDLFSEVAGSVNVEDVRTALTGLADQIETHERKLSKEYQRFEDL
jgi:hypothetical protein